MTKGEACHSSEDVMSTLLNLTYRSIGQYVLGLVYWVTVIWSMQEIVAG